MFASGAWDMRLSLGEMIAWLRSKLVMFDSRFSVIKKARDGEPPLAASNNTSNTDKREETRF